MSGFDNIFGGKNSGFGIVKQAIKPMGLIDAFRDKKPKPQTDAMQPKKRSRAPSILGGGFMNMLEQ